MIDMKKAMNFRETFTEFMRDLSPVDVNGEQLGVRVNRSSALVTHVGDVGW